VLQVVASGLALGSIYALVALGFSITYVTTSTLNFAQGELVMVGALVGLSLHVTFGLPLLLAVPLTLLAVALLSVVVQQVAVAPFARAETAIGWILSTVAVAIVLRNVAEIVWGREALRFPSPVGDDLVALGPVQLQPQQLLVLAALALVVVALTVFLGRTVWGKALSAVAQNRGAAALSGIPPAAVAAMAYALSGALAGAAGLLVAPITFASAGMGIALVIKSFAVAVLAGLGSFRGAVVAGLAFGAAEALVARYLGSEYRDIFGLLLLVAVLAARPTGLFGRREVVKV
jgi:branched-chain amino acid transport system permease protein